MVYLAVLKSDQDIRIKMVGPRRAHGCLEGFRGKELLVIGPHLTNTSLFLYLKCHTRASSVML